MHIEEIPAKPKEHKIIRVVAYARVSTDKDAAFHSLEAQTDYYRNYVQKHPDWELVGIYADNGISGTIADRPEFQRMLAECRAGKVDMVITKSITRFARNTVVLLKTVRELLSLGIDCYFEKEQMHSNSLDGEFILSVLAAYAEAEAQSVSENMKWRIRDKFKRGETTVGKMLGYRLENGVLTVVPEEAELVRWIFSEYLAGRGVTSIAKELTLREIPSPRGGVWCTETVRKILYNEKYLGNMLLQKTYRPDFRTKKTKKNRGELKMYRVRHSHEPIIDEATSQALQAEIQFRRQSHWYTDENKVAGYHLFHGFLRCGYCGRMFKYYHTNAKKYDKAVYACPRFYNMGKEICPSQRIPEDILIAKTKEVLQVEDLDRQVLEERLQRIEVPEHNHLVYFLRNGEKVDTTWDHRSRRQSWTPEMRQAAREKELARRESLNPDRKETV